MISKGNPKATCITDRSLKALWKETQITPDSPLCCVSCIPVFIYYLTYYTLLNAKSCDISVKQQQIHYYYYDLKFCTKPIPVNVWLKPKVYILLD